MGFDIAWVMNRKIKSLERFEPAKARLFPALPWFSLCLYLLLLGIFGVTYRKMLTIAANNTISKSKQLLINALPSSILKEAGPKNKKEILKQTSGKSGRKSSQSEGGVD